MVRGVAGGCMAEDVLGRGGHARQGGVCGWGGMCLQRWHFCTTSNVNHRKLPPDKLI